MFLNMDCSSSLTDNLHSNDVNIQNVHEIRLD